ncbi:MAG: MT-A70 family methyltransferase [Xanthobacteraceae bacterium]
MSEVPFHPLANLFPLMEGEAFDDLVRDICANGQREQIVAENGMILDGRNRYRGCLAAGVAPRFREFGCDSGDGDDPLGFVVSRNLNRRHLDESQRAMVAARLATMRQGERTDLQPSATLPKVAQPQAAALMNVSARLLRSAKTVLENGAPALVRAVEQGRLTVSEGAIAARLGPVQQEKIARAAEAGQKNATRAIVKRSARDAREASLGAAQAAGNLKLPEKRYGVILADPPWRFEPRSRETGMDRAADNHYPTQNVEAIIAIDVPSIAADDCVLFEWATAPILPQALVVMAAWGFDYKTHLIWHKLRSGNRRGTGYWATGEHELLLIGTRGQIPSPTTAMCASLIAAPWQGRHSAKPELFLQMIQHYFPTLPKIELNRRGPPRPGWDAWGNEAQQPTERAAGPDLSAASACTPLSATMQAGAGSPPAQDNDGLDIPNFLRIGHPDCWRSKTQGCAITEIDKMFPLRGGNT